jgi:transcriptional regulator with XRE-family HTH domain
VHLRERLSIELNERRRRNPRYSLRAFARDLLIDHATLSQILRGRRRPSARLIGILGRRLGLDRTDLVDAVARQQAETVAQFVQLPEFVPDTRQIAIRTGLSIDQVNAALDWLLRHRELRMTSKRRWTLLSD